MLEAIKNRRSIRRFAQTPVPRSMIEEILEAGRLAPSAKNRQPWRFVVATGSAKDELCAAFRTGLAREQRQPLLPDSAEHLAGAANTCAIMEQAPVIIVIANALGAEITRPLCPEEQVAFACNAQSIGAAIENMALAATSLGLGSLWICDTYFAQVELRAWLETAGEPFAALAIGFPAETPLSRPRKELDCIVQWRT